MTDTVVSNRRITTASISAGDLAVGHQVDLRWPAAARIINTLQDDALPFVLKLVIEWHVDPDDPADRPVVIRSFRGYRDSNSHNGERPVPLNATYLGTVLDGPSGALHVYEVHA